MVQNHADSCRQLRRLHERLVEELRLLKDGLRETELESFENPIETVQVIKSLQEALHTVNQVLAKCPAEND